MHACAIGTKKVSPGNCPAGQVREQVCNNSCQYDAAGPCKDRNKLTLGTMVGNEASTDIKVLATDLIPHPDVSVVNGFDCPVQELTPEDTTGALVTLVNPNNVAARVEIRLDAVDDTVLAVYPGTPNPPASMLQCIGAFNDDCGGVFGEPSCLIGADAVTVPANSSILAYVSLYSPTNTDPFDFTIKAKIVGLP
jgi:hypothetical protein